MRCKNHPIIPLNGREKISASSRLSPHITEAMPDTEQKNNDSKPPDTLGRNLLRSTCSLVPRFHSISDVSEPSRSDSPRQSMPQPSPSSPALTDGDTIELSELGNDTSDPSRVPCAIHQPTDSGESNNRAVTAIEHISSPNDQPAVLSSRGSSTQIREGGQMHRCFRSKSLGGGGLSNLIATLSLVGMLFFGVRTYILTLWGAQTQGLGTCAAFVQVSRVLIRAQSSL